MKARDLLVAQPAKRARENDTTDPPSKQARFTLLQLGGGTGGSAGDACIVSLGDRHLVVDFGKASQAEELKDLLKGAKGYDAVITHFHADHCGESAQWKKATRLFLNHTSLKLSWDEAISVRERKRKSPAEFPENGELFWSVEYQNLKADVWFIRGYWKAGLDEIQEENGHSAGVYGEVRRGGVVKFRWLSLGDMVTEAWRNVKPVLKQHLRGAKLNYVKLPHHGSPNNHMAELFRDYVDTNTVLACSGYNYIDGAWDKIHNENSELRREQITILTREEVFIGTNWKDNLQRSWSKTIDSTEANLALLEEQDRRCCVIL